MRSRTSSKRAWRRKKSDLRFHAPASERGTVLLIVIGVLALLAIFALVYASLGQSDRRTSAAYVRSVQIEDVSSQFSNYIAGIIGDDVFQTVTEEYGDGISRERRVTWTYPSIAIDSQQVSNVHLTGGQQFRPLGGGYQPWLAPAEPTVLRYNGAPNWTNQNHQYLNFRDWLTISNVVPDGQFVNLANLRNNFFAEPGVGNDSNGRPRMSEKLVLFDANGAPMNAVSRLIDNQLGLPNVPWHWTAYQRHAARPMRSDALGAAYPLPGDHTFLANQWADTDGDGIADARWFLLNAPGGEDNEFTLPGLAQGDKMRYVGAVRIIDTSGSINVSTAMDTRIEPVAVTGSRQYPYGVTPADVDLLRILTLADVYQRYNEGYDALLQPSVAQDAANYSDYTGTSADPVARQVGEAAYQSLRWHVAHDRLRPQDRQSITNNSGLINLTFGELPVVPNTWDINPANRARLYAEAQRDASATGGKTTSVAVYDPMNVGAEPEQGFLSRTPFGMDETYELHTFFGLNNPQHRSRLEAVLEGRFSNGGSSYATFGPLRSTRGLDLERDHRSNAVNQLQSDESLALQHMDVRRRLTTIASARPFTSLAPRQNFNRDVISDSEVRVDLSPYLVPNRALSNDMANEFFNHIADALMPYRNVSGSDNVWENSPENATLHYGGRAEIAARSSAHLYANLRDSVDNDNVANDDVSGPTAVTLQLLRNSGGGAGTNYPWPELRLHDDNELASSASDLHSSRVNIYGIEAQPFLVEAYAVAFFTDAPPDAGGDDEYVPPTNPGDPEFLVPITLDDNVSASNSDFLGEIIAFQITNPFDRPIRLTRAGTGEPEILYYVEYAGRFFPLAEFSDTGTFTNTDQRLAAGTTKVFYATSPRRKFDFNARFQRIGASSSPPVMVGDVIEDWVQSQFRQDGEPETRDPVLTTMFNPETGATVEPEGGADDGLMDLHGEYASPAATTEDRRVVKLWRVMRDDTNDALPNSNSRSNDLMVDRMRDPSPPGSATLFARLNAAGDEIAGTEAGRDGSINPRDNTGFSVATWGAVRRPTYTSTVSIEGAMPPWCIEARPDSFYSSNPSYNDDESGPSGLGTRADYISGTDSRYDRFSSFVSDLTNVTTPSDRLNNQIRRRAEAKTGNGIIDSFSVDAGGNQVPYERNAVRISLGGIDAGSPAVARSPGLFKRLGDILLPLAIGPYYDPGYTSGLDGEDRMTLSEILALASDYYSPPTSHLYHLAGHYDLSSPRTPGAPYRKFDLGHLVLDDFVPIFERNPNGRVDVQGDVPLGLGIPLALNLLDKFRLDDAGGKGKGEIGKVNINTTTLLTAAALPMLTPDPLSSWMTEVTANREYLYNPAVHTADRAATLISYRDKLEMMTRRLFTGAPTGAPLSINFRNSTNPLITPWRHDGRARRTLIPNLREQAGFRSPGEILAAVLRDRPGDEVYNSNSMDWFARDGLPLKGHGGIDAATMGTTNPIRNDEIIDDYNEKIAIANAAIGSITTRSDTFCVWFILHGYQQSDVEGLNPRDPMVPSIAKRFMMIVDRSNVVKKGDAPRILLFREVPM